MNGACPSLPARPRRRIAGFSLIELMIAVAVIALLGMIAMPTYMSAVRKGRRADAINALATVQRAQEKWRGENAAYTTSLSSFNPALTTNSPNGHYTVSITSADGSGYVVAARASGGQASDTDCATMAVRLATGTLSYGSSASSTIDWTDAKRCWAK